VVSEIRKPGEPAATAAAQASPGLREQVARVLRFIRRGLRYWYVTPVALVLGGGACVGYFALQPPMYRSEVALLHTDGIASTDPNEPVAAPRNIAVRVQEILMSRQLLGRVLDDFGLYGETRRRYGAAEAVEELKKHLQFKAPGGNTFRIAFDGSSPEQAEHVTARLAELVISSDSQLRTTQARLTEDFLASEKARTEAGLRDTERQLASFMAEHPRFALDTTPLTSGAAIRASVPAGAPAPSHSDAVRSRNPRTAPPPLAASTTAPSGPSEATHEALRERARAVAALDAARTRLADELAQFTPAHPDVRAARVAVALAEARLDEAVANENLREAAPVAAPPLFHEAAAPAQRPAYAPLHAGVTPVASTVPEDVVALETQWAVLTRNVVEARQHYDQVQTALFKADMTVSSVSEGQHGTQMLVIDEAFLPQRPVPPGRATIMAIIGALSLLLGWLVALVCGALDDRVYTGLDLPAGRTLLEVPRIRGWRRARAVSR
jgi:uncharacterized protein involved in exopolysaccharide biosynthesis